MEEGRFDRVLNKMTARVERVSDKIAREFKGAKPFDKEQVDSRQQVYDYQTNGYEIFRSIADTKGIDAAVQWQREMENLQEKFNGK